MQKKRTIREIIAVEEAIKEKYGEECVKDIEESWDKKKEEEYFEEIQKDREKSQQLDETNQKVLHDGFLISKKLLNRDKQDRKCPVCFVFSFEPSDNLYINRYECCHKCFIQYVEGREERWNSGWRPSNEDKNKRS